MLFRFYGKNCTVFFAGFFRKKKRSVEDEEDKERLLLQILELISSAEDHRLFIQKLAKSKDQKSCLLQRLCSRVSKFQDQNHWKVKELMKQYRSVIVNVPCPSIWHRSFLFRAFSRESSEELNDTIGSQLCHERFKCQL